VFGSLPDEAEYGTPEYRVPDEAVLGGRWWCTERQMRQCTRQVRIERVAQRLPMGQCASLELAPMH